MVLVDTSVWVDHFQKGNRKLTALLLDDLVLVHPFVMGELSLGHLKDRREILALLQRLPEASIASHQEVLEFSENHRLQGKGVGWVDVHLLASCALSNAKLWTRDKALGNCAAVIKVGY